MADAPAVDVHALLALPDDERRLDALLQAAGASRRGDPATLRSLAEHALGIAKFLHDGPARLAAMALLAHAAFRQANYGEAQQLALEALRSAHVDPTHDPASWDRGIETLPTRALEALTEAATALSIATFRLTDYPNALLYANLEVHLRRAVRDAVGEALALHGLGWGYDKVGLYQQALDHHLRALSILEEVAPERTASPLNGVAATYLDLGQLDKALEHSRRALEVIGERTDLQRELSTALRAIGMVRERQGDVRAAELSFQRSMAVSDAYGISLNLLSLGEMFLNLGRFDEALDHFRRCLQDLDGGARKRSRCQALLGMAEVYLAREDPSEARELLLEALEAAHEIGSPLELQRVYHGLARAHRGLGDTGSALESFEAYHRYRERLLREASDVRTQVLTLEYDVDRLRRDREIDRLRNVELARAYGELRQAHAQLERQAAELERLSNLDGLTGLANRRSLDGRIDVEVARARRNGTELALLMLDIDHFKAINDRFSHTIGDEVLKRLALLLRSAIRDVDVAARFGGEEFVLLLPDTEHSGALAVAEKVRASIENAGWGSVHPELRVTVSIGAASLRVGEDASTVLARADAMLYRAKQAGRNCVVG